MELNLTHIDTQRKLFQSHWPQARTKYARVFRCKDVNNVEMNHV